ncbi:Excalibur calcium-binding domain-containing protein [Arthrobacter sp. VKM Ac-2550]|nr:Excalibur calcium-binding domain-containing protein [Arthrobacter sp. VKM Ac-2550]
MTVPVAVKETPAKQAPAKESAPKQSAPKQQAPAAEQTQQEAPCWDEATIIYENCTDVKANGAAPTKVGDLGWDQKLDRDGDGVGCEGWPGRSVPLAPRVSRGLSNKNDVIAVAKLHRVFAVQLEGNIGCFLRCSAGVRRSIRCFHASEGCCRGVAYHLCARRPVCVHAGAFIPCSRHR